MHSYRLYGRHPAGLSGLPCAPRGGGGAEEGARRRGRAGWLPQLWPPALRLSRRGILWTGTVEPRRAHRARFFPLAALPGQGQPRPGLLCPSPGAPVPRRSVYPSAVARPHPGRRRRPGQRRFPTLGISNELLLPGTSIRPGGFLFGSNANNVVMNIFLVRFCDRIIDVSSRVWSVYSAPVKVVYDALQCLLVHRREQRFDNP